MVLSNPLYLSEIKLYPLKVVASQLNNSLQNHNPKLGILFLQFLILSSLQNFYENISIVNNPYILYKEFLESELFNLVYILFIIYSDRKTFLRIQRLFHLILQHQALA